MDTLYLFPPDDNPQKRCTGACGKFLPATTEFFSPSKTGKYGVASECKACINAKRRKLWTEKSRAATDIPENHKQCTGPCRRILPATAEYFHRNKSVKGGFNSQCRECRNKRSIPPTGYKICAGACGRTLPATTEYFYHNPRGKRSNVGNRCKECIKSERRELGKLPENIEKRRNYEKKRRANPEVLQYLRDLDKKRHSSPKAKELHRIRSNNRHARKKSVSGTHTPEQIQDHLKRQKHKCYYCSKKFQKVDGRYVYHIEHTFPISRVAGTDIPANSIDYIVLACPTCNDSKGNKFPWEWPEGGRLC